MVWEKNVAIFDWKWGRNSAPRDGRKIARDTGNFSLKLSIFVVFRPPV